MQLYLHLDEQLGMCSTHPLSLFSSEEIIDNQRLEMRNTNLFLGEIAWQKMRKRTEIAINTEKGLLRIISGILGMNKDMLRLEDNVEIPKACIYEANLSL